MPRIREDLHQAACERCGKPFFQRRKTGRFCSQACSNKAYPGQGGTKPAVGLDPRTCEVCGKQFEPYRKTQTACSPMCYHKSPRGIASKQRQNERRRTDPDVVAQVRIYNRKQQLLRRYGMTVEQWDAKLAAQNGVCMICGQPPKPNGVKAASRLHVDHDHVTGQNRDLICINCNQGIGYFKDDPALMRAAAEYIERHRKGSNDG